METLDATGESKNGASARDRLMASTAELASGAVAREHPVRSARTVIGGILALAVPHRHMVRSRYSMDATPKHALAVSSFMIIAWISEVMPHAVTGLIGCYLFWILGVAKFELAFSGLVDQTPWFLFGAGLIGMMATKTGLARRFAYMVMRRAGTSYSGILLGLILTSFLLTLLVPSGLACVVIMATVALGLMEALGAARGSNIGKGIFVTLDVYGRLLRQDGDCRRVHDPWPRPDRTRDRHAHLLEPVVLRILALRFDHDFFHLASGAVAFPAGEGGARRGGSISRGRAGEDGPLEPGGEAGDDPDAAGDRPVDDRPAAPHFSGGDWHRRRAAWRSCPGWACSNQEDLKRYNFLPILFVAAAISMGNVLVQTQALDVLTTVMFSWMRPLDLRTPPVWCWCLTGRRSSTTFFWATSFRCWPRPFLR